MTATCLSIWLHGSRPNRALPIAKPARHQSHRTGSVHATSHREEPPFSSQSASHLLLLGCPPTSLVPSRPTNSNLAWPIGYRPIPGALSTFLLAPRMNLSCLVLHVSSRASIPTDRLLITRPIPRTRNSLRSCPTVKPVLRHRGPVFCTGDRSIRVHRLAQGFKHWKSS